MTNFHYNDEKKFPIMLWNNQYVKLNNEVILFNFKNYIFSPFLQFHFLEIFFSIFSQCSIIMGELWLFRKTISSVLLICSHKTETELEWIFPRKWEGKFGLREEPCKQEARARDK